MLRFAVDSVNRYSLYVIVDSLQWVLLAEPERQEPFATEQTIDDKDGRCFVHKSPKCSRDPEIEVLSINIISVFPKTLRA